MTEDEELWADIDAQFNLDPRMPGDIDIDDLIAHFSKSGKPLSRNGANGRMEQLARSGKWRILVVADDNSATGKRKVIRRVRACPN